jgi:hypothetical protein
MTTADLVRAARDIVPPVGASAAIAVVDHEPGEKLKSGEPAGRGGLTTYRAAFLVAGRQISAPVGPTFERPRDLYRFLDVLTGEPQDPRSASRPDLARAVLGDDAERRDAVTTSIEAPDALRSRHGTCVNCGRLLPPGGRPQRRTCSDACRRAAARAAADEARVVSSGGGEVVTVSGPSEADTPDPTPRAAAGGGYALLPAPAPGAGSDQLPGRRPGHPTLGLL